MTTTTSTPSSSIAPPISSFDPQLLKLLARHHHHFNQQPSAKEFLQHAFYFNHPPPNTVATLSPRHHLSNGLSKLNTENSTSNTKLSSITTTTTNGKLDQQQIISPNNTQIKKPIIQQQQVKDALAFDQWLQPPLGSIIQGPPCLQPDTSSSSSSSSSTSSATAGSKCETTLSSGERITCFVVGGEKRLCLPEILNTVLKDFSLQEINAACERLHIYCSRCTNEQLDTLKKTQVLPMNAPSCGLITQTDAERLCANLLQLHYKGQLHTINSATTNPYERLYSIKVQHKCFGKCSGTLYPTLYIAAQAECIQCDTCQALFSPKTFVSHGHKSEENRICHWGFNSDNWRSYLKIRSTEDMKAREEMELFKEKFLHSHSTINQKKRLTQQQDCLVSTEKRLKLAPSSSTDAWPYPYNQSNYVSMKKDNHGEYSFGACLPRPSLIAPPLPLALPIETTTTATASNSCPRPSPLRVVQSNSPVPNERPAPSITNFNDFTPDGIRQIVESTVSSPRSRQQLITYISQLQLHTYTQSSRTNSTVGDTHQQNEIVLLRRENELLRERLSKIENNQISSNSSTISNGSKFSSNENNPQHDSIAGDSDDLDSNVSSQSVSSSLVAHETTNEQPKYFDRKRRLLAAEQQISTSETDTLVIKKSSPHKKACLDDIVDTLNQKAQAEKYDEDEQDENIINELEIKQEQNDDDDDDDEEEEEELLDETNNNNNNNNSEPSSTTTTTEIEDEEEEEEKEEGEAEEEEEEDIDVDGVKLTIDDHH
ncbi:unnamed protein product [Adineta steineri]|uniref:c-SKI SMAD4-binding domain-containing protein n=1 Tax=Adineta steineri TaxID=433720 RepID=A0A814M576_9BILA|nr:unnamed protein product [Adineta steineri]CAF1140800.1 unnamed protein product [Adineta steineri]